MKKQDLINSGVTFRTEGHTYTRDADGKRLQGVTKMIQETLYPSEFDRVDPDVLKAKADYGTRRHREIQDMIVFGDKPETKAQKDFAALMEGAGLVPIASEYTVTDGEEFASSIDVLCEDCSIVDIKTVSSLNRQKVAWQLSLYAMFFETVNPGAKAGRLFAAWLPKGGEPRLVEVWRRDDEDLRRLMKCWLEGTPFERGSKLSVPNLERIAELKLRMAELQREYNEVAAAVMEDMKEKGETSWSDEYCAISYTPATSSKRFDSASFRKADPETYAAYVKESATKESLRVTLR